MVTKREGSPAQIRAMQDADHLEAASEGAVDIFHKPRPLDGARSKAHSKNRLEREYT